MNLGDKEEENLISHSEENIQVSGRKLCPKEESPQVASHLWGGEECQARRAPSAWTGVSATWPLWGEQEGSITLVSFLNRKQQYLQNGPENSKHFGWQMDGSVQGKFLPLAQVSGLKRWSNVVISLYKNNCDLKKNIFHNNEIFEIVDFIISGLWLLGVSTSRSIKR